MDRDSTRDFRIGFWNINGIKGKWAEATQLINSFDIFGIAETKLVDGDNTPSLKSFHSIRRDGQFSHREGRGGLIVYIKKPIFSISELQYSI